jgi:mRNA-degrading endonuclease HigB of HigAB toxin-antitoxin module
VRKPVFDIGGNEYRLPAAIDFEEQTLTIEPVTTHEKRLLSIDDRL